MIREIFILLVTILYSLNVSSQTIDVNDKIIMTGNTNEERKLKNVSSPQMETDAFNERFLLSGAVNYATSTGQNDTLHLTIYPLPLNLNKGLIINFISPINNNNKLVAEINGNGVYIELTKNVDESLDSSDIRIGQTVAIVYDGNNFQVFSELNTRCPSGFVYANKEFCITPDEPAPVYFWGAVRNCGKRNARVCSWGEWYYACVYSTELGMQNMVGNFEWLDAGGNSLASSSNTGLMIGDTTCSAITTSITDSTIGNIKAVPKPYRCCYSLIK